MENVASAPVVKRECAFDGVLGRISIRQLQLGNGVNASVNPVVVYPCKGAFALTRRAHDYLQLGALLALLQHWQSDSCGRLDEDLESVPAFHSRGRSTYLGKRDNRHGQRAIEVNDQSLARGVSKSQESIGIVAGGLVVLAFQVDRNPHVAFPRGGPPGFAEEIQLIATEFLQATPQEVPARSRPAVLSASRLNRAIAYRYDDLLLLGAAEDDRGSLPK
jgi:hypothetical protein